MYYLLMNDEYDKSFMIVCVSKSKEKLEQKILEVKKELQEYQQLLKDYNEQYYKIVKEVRNEYVDFILRNKDALYDSSNYGVGSAILNITKDIHYFNEYGIWLDYFDESKIKEDLPNEIAYPKRPSSKYDIFSFLDDINFYILEIEEI